MSYSKYKHAYYRSHHCRAWIKHCAKKLRRLEERQIIQQEQDCYTWTPPVPAGSDQSLLESRARQRKQRRACLNKWHRLRRSQGNYMSQEFVQELFAALKKDKWRFYYRQGDYAWRLLSYVVQHSQSLRMIRQSPFGRLLAKPAVQPLIAQLGGAQLRPELLFGTGAALRECYVLSLDEWGEEAARYPDAHQTSRSGKNLVLQLNFSGQHNRPYERLLNPICFHPFEAYGHPIAAKPRCTMAWVRIDIADDLSHALIEEIQTDWLRFARYANTWRTRRDHGSRTYKAVKEHCNGQGVSEAAWQDYERVLRPHRKHWAEATLCAAIVLLKEEMGINRIFYHTFTSGNFLKGIAGHRAPPKSLYSTLPERFCFTRTREQPPMLAKHVEALKQAAGRDFSPLAFYVLDFTNVYSGNVN